MSKPGSKPQIKIFLSDVDGTMTDGARYLSETGPEIKKFSIPDGMGLLCLKRLGVKIGLVTAETGALAVKRGEALRMDYVLTGVTDKLATVKEIAAKAKVDMCEIAYIGDDLNDYRLLAAVGYAACPADAQPIVQKIPGIQLMKRKGGDGALREFINQLVGEEVLLEQWEKFGHS